MNAQATRLAETYVQTVNRRDAAAFIAIFADDAMVDDNGREFRGRDAIKEWSDREIFATQVTLEVIDAFERDNEDVIVTKVDGNFDRTGLPDPVIIEQRFKSTSGKITSLTCRLAGQ